MFVTYIVVCHFTVKLPYSRT